MTRRRDDLPGEEWVGKPAGTMTWVPDPSPEPWELLANQEGWSGRDERDRPATVRVGESMVWGRSVIGYHPKHAACPACHDVKLPRGWICLVCHATATDPTRWPMREAVRRAKEAKKKPA